MAPPGKKRQDCFPKTDGNGGGGATGRLVRCKTSDRQVEYLWARHECWPHQPNSSRSSTTIKFLTSSFPLDAWLVLFKKR